MCCCVGEELFDSAVDSAEPPRVESIVRRLTTSVPICYAQLCVCEELVNGMLSWYIGCSRNSVQWASLLLVLRCIRVAISLSVRFDKFVPPAKVGVAIAGFKICYYFNTLLPWFPTGVPRNLRVLWAPTSDFSQWFHRWCSRVSLSGIRPRIQLLYRNYQAQVSHWNVHYWLLSDANG